MKTILISFAFLLALLTPVHAQGDAEPTDADKAFFRELKRAALAGDRAWVVAHVCFPVRATVAGHTRMIANAGELEEAYAEIMTLDTVNAIRRQSPETLVRTRQGVMIGDGEIWIGEDGAVPAGEARKICIIAFGNAG